MGRLPRSSFSRVVLAILAVPIVLQGSAVCAGRRLVDSGKFNGWDTVRLANGIITVHLAPQIGGRIVGYAYRGHQFFFASRSLAGKVLPWTDKYEPKSGWLNYGGEKVWPAPEGWDGPKSWPGPGNTELEAGKWSFKVIRNTPDVGIVRMVSPKDAYTGLQYARDISIRNGSAVVEVKTTQKNVSSKPVEWSVWTVTQIDAAGKGNTYNRGLTVHCPINPRSRHPRGYDIAFGAEDNPTWQPRRDGKVLLGKYHYRVGKVWLDSPFGWIGIEDTSSGYAFVQRFRYFPGKDYPDKGSTIECYSNGAGPLSIAGKESVVPNDPKTVPFYVELEILSPMVELAPGQEYSFTTEWEGTRGPLSALIGRR